MQGTGNDFRRRGRAGIDQHGHGQATGQVARLRIVAFNVLGFAPALGHHFAATEEHVGNADRLIEQAAGIVAQVKDQTLHIGVLGHQVLQGGGRLCGGLFVEGRDTQIAVVAFHPRLGGLHIDDFPNQLDVKGFGLAAHDREGQGLTRLAAHLFDRVIEGEAQKALAIDRGNIVARLQTRPRGGGVVHGRDDLHRALFAGHLNAQPAIFAARLIAHFGKALRIEIA